MSIFDTLSEYSDLIGFIALMATVFFVIPVAVGALVYFVPKKMGYPKTARYLAAGYGLVLSIMVLFTLFEDQLFMKRDAIKLIEEQGITLADDFLIKNNESMSSPGDYYHTFTLTISENDRLNAIRKIKASEDFKNIGEYPQDLLVDTPDQYNGPRVAQNYETENHIAREYFKPNGQGYAPTFRRILVSKRTNELTFEDIDL